MLILRGGEDEKSGRSIPGGIDGQRGLHRLAVCRPSVLKPDSTRLSHSLTVGSSFRALKYGRPENSPLTPLSSSLLQSCTRDICVQNIRHSL